MAGLATRPNIVVRMRHTDASGRQASHDDETGQYRGENMRTGKGRREAEAIGQAFARRGLSPDGAQVVAEAV